MAFTISRLRVVAADDAEFSDLVAALPDGAETCLYCGRRSRDSLAMVLLADESDDNPLALCTVVCSMCSTVHPSASVPATKCNGRTMSASTWVMPLMIKLRSTSPAVFTGCSGPSWGL